MLKGVSFLDKHDVAGKGIGPEAAICIDFANWLRKETLSGRLRSVWFHVPNEGRRSMRQGRIMRAMGLIPGAPDYVFLCKNKTLAIEMKTRSGKLSENQRVFQKWCKKLKIEYVVCRSLAAAVETVTKTSGLWRRRAVR